ncbi:MAG TPA: hypothetical protein VKP69_16530 [Isosphaeraceae bacterium]|nr:hypothetical protein [Isosphaeraceae bacterium]
MPEADAPSIPEGHGDGIEDEAFIGHGMLSTSNRYLKATATGRLQIEAGWTVVPTRVRREASIGGGAVVL